MAIKEDNILSFTNQDYDSILEEIRLTKKELMPEYTDESETDFGNRLLTYSAMLFDILSWKVDYSINESIPFLCKTIKAMYKHCKWIGYNPKSNQASNTTFQITIKNNGKAQSLGKGFKITMEYQVSGNHIIYELDDFVDCTAPEGTLVDALYTINAKGTQGESISETIGISNGKADQDFYITYYPYIEGSLEIEAYNPSNGTYEFYVINENNSFVGTTSTDKIIVLEQIDSTLIKIRFGDGYNGKIPIMNSVLTANYRIGGGVIGNRPANVINVPISEMPENFISISNITEAVGGIDAEGVTEIKTAIEKGQHRIIYSLMRISDFEKFLRNRSDTIEKFLVCQDETVVVQLFKPIAIYLKPYNGLTFDISYKTELQTEIDKWKLIDDKINLYDCIPVYCLISLKIKTDGLTLESQLLYAIKYALKLFIENISIGTEDETVGLYSDDVRTEVRQIEGVSRFISLDILKTKYGEIISTNGTVYSADVKDLIILKGQLFRIENIETDINITFV